MTYLDAIILAIVEGITEFLPISSTGHLVLTSHLLNIPQTDFAKSFEIIIQLGAILAVVVLYFQKLSKNTQLWKKIIVAFLPTAIIGFTLYKVVKDVLLGNLLVTVLALFIGGVVLIIFEKLVPKKKAHSDLKGLSLKACLTIGLFQTISLIPGVSRAASTIVGAMLVGLKREEAVEFSFYLAIPTMIAASGYDALKNKDLLLNGDLILLATGFVISFITALIAIRFFIKFVQNHTFIPFGIYRIILALVFGLFLLK